MQLKCVFPLIPLTGLLNLTPIHTGRHTRSCIVRNGGDPDDFDWEGKPSFEDLLSETEENGENADPNVSPHKVRVIEKLPDDGRARATDVSEDMKILTDKLATENLATLPSEIWMMVKDEMDKKSRSPLRGFERGLCLFAPVSRSPAGSKGGAKCNY